jgi:3-hydroxyisobutyrate dehydrogenase-like beta-hydroxyacid dehydrogenase
LKKMDGDEGVDVAIGFLGFGEAGRTIARGLRAAGAARVSAYDIGQESTEGRELFEARAAEAGVTLESSARALVEANDVVISAVVASVAVEIAEQVAPSLAQRHFYVDLNSTSPEVKQRIAGIVSATGARFVEAAVMAGVLPLGHKVPMLLCGKAAPDLIEQLSPLGMNLEDFGPEIGRATATKMFRSIVVKGLEALFLECALSASRYGVTERVLDYVGVGYPGIDWNKLAHKLIGRTAIHGERRAHELEEVAATLEAMGIEPIMARAGARRLRECAELGLKSRFGDWAPESYHEVLRAIEEAKRT